MGFLDHSTNNIVVDAVLTDLGRQALAKNDGSFSIYQFALGDDEIDYSIIQQFGRTVGKEKIEKNTPILEYDLLDPEVLVEINHLYLGIVGESPDIRYTDNIAVYRMPTNQSSTGDRISAKIPLRIKSFAPSTFATHSVAGNTYIRTYVKITGINSGLTKTIEVQIR